VRLGTSLQFEENMSVYASAELDNIVKIDENHALFIQSLVMCKKPRKVLEFGFGTGESTRAILAGLRFNSDHLDYTVVDNWADFGGKQPKITKQDTFSGVNFVTSNEFDYVINCKERYDFIFSDADHLNTQLWFEAVYNNFLVKEGIIVYHDVTNTSMFPNLLEIYADTIKNNYHHVLLNRNSRPGERCDRGLLAIFKH
jgi:caffeoyl-CoA O-methyltransferase